MSGYLAACRAYYSDRSEGKCLTCRGGRVKECECIGCFEGMHRPPDPQNYARQKKQRTKGRSDNSDLFA